MPPEPVPWDRKDFFKERKHERSEPPHHHHHHPHPHPIGGGGFGGVGGFGGGGGPRWREPPHPHPHPYHYASPRWAPDFRYRPPTGYGKQGGRHLYPEEASHGFMPSRPNDKILEDESFRASGSGKYSRNSRENRASFGQKDWKGHSWEATPSTSGPGRPNDVTDQQRLVDDTLTYNSSHPHSDSANSWDQSQFKDQHEKNGGVSATASSGMRFERENSLGSIDWKPLKWTRSGSLSSRGSGFSHSSSSKSMGADSSEMKAEVQLNNLTPVQSPSGDAATPVAAPATACETSSAPSEETSSRKKPRLGWGEGLAKYEKKKVEGHDDSAPKNGMVICSSREPLHLYSLNLADKSPRVTVLSDCGSPATPSSVGCSSSPGIEEKQFVKPGNADHDTTNLSLSPGIVSQNHVDTGSFNLEILDLAPISCLNSAINELLQSDDLSSVDSGFVKSTAINKLLVWKGDVLKALELTESEIDKLEGELKLISQPESSCPHPAGSSSQPVDCHSKPTDDQNAAPDVSHRPAPLVLALSGDNDTDKVPNAMELQHVEVRDEDVDSPGSATSKFVEVPSSGKDVCPSEPGNHVELTLKSDVHNSRNPEAICLGFPLNEDGVEISACGGSQLVAGSSSRHVDDFSFPCDREDKLYESILASNRECANRAAEVYNKLLPTNQCTFDVSSASGISCLENSHTIKEKLLKRKRCLRFKERIIALKFRVFQHFWKEDSSLPSIRKFRVKSQKKLDMSLRAVHGVHQKHRFSIRSKFASPSGNISLTPTIEMINFVSKLISDSQLKPLRDTLNMPALILDKKEKIISRFVSTNGLVEDPCAVEKERSMINPWTTEEKEIFMDKLAMYGKDFRKIASFLVHKTAADCIEFYYKNHKSDCFRKIKKHPDLAKQGKAYSTNNYLVASGKRWNREANAASLDILGAASAIAANVEDGMEIEQKCTSKYLLGMSYEYKTSRGDTGLLERSSSLDADNSERETVAADVLAGICGSLSSEAMSSCITSAVEPGEGYREWKCQRVGSTSRWQLTTEVTQNVDDETCSDESCGEMDSTDWTDEEKSIFIQAVSSYGKDFAMVSRCVRTRSKDQCKVFFSKARKCLGLDIASPGSGNVVRSDANGGGSDTDDACVVENGSGVSSEKSGVKIEVDLPSPDMKLNSELDLSGVINVKPDLNRLDKSSGTGELEFIDTKHQSNNLIDDPQTDKPEKYLDGDSGTKTFSSVKYVEVQDLGTSVIPSGIEAEDNVEEASDHPDKSHIQIDSGVVDKLAKHQQECVLPERSTNDDDKKKDDANLNDPSDSDQDMTLRLQVPNKSSLAADMDSSSGCGGILGYVQNVDLESDSSQKPCVIPLQQRNYPVPMNLVPQVSIAARRDEGTSSALGNDKICGEQGLETSRPGKQYFSRGSVLGNVESSRIVKGYAAQVSTTREVNGDSSCRRTIATQSIPKLDKNFDPDQNLARDSHLQKCNGTKQHNSVSELPFQSQEQSRDNHLSSQSGSSSGMEKPRRNGDVKLFGQILTKPLSLQKSSPSIQNGDTENHHSKVGKAFNVKFTSDQSVPGNSAQAKLDRNNYLGSENLPVRSYGFWDGSRIQTGFSSLPDSAMVLAKYPAAFVDYAMPSSKMDQLPLHGVSTRERNLNGSSSLPAREMGSSNGVADYQVYRNGELQPFTMDVKQRQDMLLSEMQRRRNGFDVVSGIQQQARGVVGINVARGGILVGGQCSGVSDPVAAIKLHYAQAEQFNGQAGSIIRDDDSWRGQGNIGR